MPDARTTAAVISPREALAYIVESAHARTTTDSTECGYGLADYADIERVARTALTALSEATPSSEPALDVERLALAIHIQKNHIGEDEADYADHGPDKNDRSDAFWLVEWLAADAAARLSASQPPEPDIK